MKKNKGFTDDPPFFNWEEMIKEKEEQNASNDNDEKYEWDRPLVDETWTIDKTGEISPAPTDSKTGIKPGSVTALLPPEDAIYNAMLSEDLDLSAQLSESLSKVMDGSSVDEKAIRSSVDKKIVIKSEELKSKRNSKDDAPRKVRRRIPKNPENKPSKYKPIEEKIEAKNQPKEEKHSEMSDFRKKSMHWRDSDIHESSPLGSDEGNDNLHSSKFIGLQWIAVALAVIIVLCGAMTTGVYASYKGEQNKARALEALKAYADTAEYEAPAETLVEEEMTDASAEPEEVVEVKTLSLVLTSVEKDLKIKLVDQDDTLVKGLSWGVKVTDSDGKISDNDDEDKDGVIYLTEIGAGDYSVELKDSSDLSGYILPKSAQMVSVKAKIEYKVIANIKDEIKTEKEVNAAVEDNGNKAADVETGSLTDTVEWVESTKTANGEQYVPSEVYLDYTATADSVKNYFALALDNLSKKFKASSNAVIGMPMLVASEPDEPTLVTSGTPDPVIPAGEPGEGEPTPTPTEEPKPDPTMSDVGLDRSTISEGETATASISVTDLSDYSVKWITSDSNVASVSGTGNTATITGHKAGSATITAEVTGGGYTLTASATLTVTAKTVSVSEVKLDKADASVLVGKTLTLKATVNPSDASNKEVCFISSDASIATVTGNGLEATVTGVAKGSAVITVTTTDGDKRATCKVTVTSDEVLIKKITLTPKELSVAVKGNYQLNISFDPAKPTDTSVIWKSEDDKIATVSNGGLVTGVKVGKTKVSATAKDGSGVKAECVVTVTDEKKYADTAQLYDKDKNPLYKKDGDKYVLAKYKDYLADKTIKLFKKTDGYLYTGWQTIDGQTYYYKRDNTYVTGEQVIGGVMYHFATDGTLTQGSGTLGIDVSKYQPSINWGSVKASGVNFVIIRCGYRGSSTGVLVQDPYFVSHIKGAKAAGLKVGVYFFTTAITEAEAIEEASMCAYLCGGYGINYPVFMDCESSNRPGYNQLSASQRTQIIQAFCNTLKSAGYTPGVYANKTWLTEKMNASALSGYKIWLAQYNPAGPTYNGRYDMWQYTSKGSVSGISGNVDMNQSYLGY